MQGIRNIAIVGVGGVGGYFGGKLCKLISDSRTVSFLARGEHLRSIQENGLLLRSESDGEIVCKPSLAADNLRELPPPDLCLLCVKEFDLAPVLSQLAPLIRADTIIIPLLNGVDIYARVRRVIRNGIVLPACVYVGTHVEKPGVAAQKGGACRILLGPDPLHREFSPAEILRLFDESMIKSEWTADIQAEIWKKFIFICAYGLVTAAFDKTVGEVLAEDALRTIAEGIISEAIAMAEATGVRLPENTAETALLKARSFPFETKTSFQRDFERADRKDERDLFVGTMIRMADDLGVPIPRTREVGRLLETRKPVQATTVSAAVAE